MTVITSFCGLCILLVLGKLIRSKIRILQKLYLPTSVIAGILGLILVQAFSQGGHPELLSNWTAGWSKLPGLLINVVFAALFLGVVIPSLRVVW